MFAIKQLSGNGPVINTIYPLPKSREIAPTQRSIIVLLQKTLNISYISS